MKQSYKKYLWLLALPLASCSTVSEIDTFRDVAAGGAAAAIVEATGQEDEWVAGAGVAGYLASNLANKKKHKIQQVQVEEAREEGRQQVMRDRLSSLYSAQGGGSGNASFHEVSVPFDEYVTSDGILMDPHEKTILAR